MLILTGEGGSSCCVVCLGRSFSLDGDFRVLPLFSFSWWKILPLLVRLAFDRSGRVEETVGSESSCKIRGVRVQRLLALRKGNDGAEIGVSECLEYTEGERR